MQDTQSNSHVEKAVTFFSGTSLSLSRLLPKVREKYIELGHVGGHVLFEDSTPGERKDIASFLGKAPYRDVTFRVKLLDVEKAVKHSFGCALPDLLRAFFPDQPLVTRQEQRTAHAAHQADFRSDLLAIATELPEASRARLWLLQGSHGLEWLFARYKNAPDEEQERQLQLARYIVRVLDQLPRSDSPERLALFAQRTSGDPHALDPDRAAGRLLLLALHDLSKGATNTVLAAGGVDPEHETLATSPPQDRAQELLLYANAGLLVDTISSNVAVFNLAAATFFGGTPDPLPSAGGRRVLLLPLRQLFDWEQALPAQPDIYVFENPQVFEEVVATLPPESTLPTLVCTSGWPSAAALKLLDLLLAQSPTHTLHYSGDFDLKGLQIAAHLMARYPGRCLPWRFEPAAYIHALQAASETGLAPLRPRAGDLNLLSTLPAVFTPLITLMQEQRQWAYQEGITRLLLTDVRRNHVEKIKTN